MDVTIDDSKQDEDGIRLFVGSTTVVTVWDAHSPEVELTIAKRIAKFLREETA